MKKIKSYLLIFILFFGCNESIYTIYKNENIPRGLQGKVLEIENFKGGNTSLRIVDDKQNEYYIGLDERFKKVVKGDFFKKYPNSNKCLLIRNDSIFYINCYEIPKSIKDSLGTIEEWENKQLEKWLKL